jgi:hypothetical protein
MSGFSQRDGSVAREQSNAYPLPLGPHLVPGPGKPARSSPLALWHLLSLDAPTVAAVWTLFLARCAGLKLGWPGPAAMFVAVWMIYAADRLLDARRLDASPDAAGLEERHRFHHAHRRPFLAGIALGAVALLYLLQQIDVRALRLYALLATLLGVWMLLIHVGTRENGQRLPKELAVALFFPAAVFIPTVSRLPALRLALLPSAVLFAGVCALNCLLLHAWEHPAARCSDDRGVHWTTRWAVKHLGLLAAVSLVLSFAAAILQRHGPGALPAVACGSSVALLWALDRIRARVSPVHLRALADLVLLSPLFCLPFLLR